MIDAQGVQIVSPRNFPVTDTCIGRKAKSSFVYSI